MSNATSFGRQAAAYKSGRPGYPDTLFRWIAHASPARDAVCDVATGSGQAAVSLAEHFRRVEATDIDAAQIAAATPHPAIRFRAAPANQSGLPDGSVDAVTVATALHWFADAPFWAEVARVARPGALFCAFVYSLPQGEPALHDILLDPLYARLDPYWSDGNRMAMRGYTAANTQCPFAEVDAPAVNAGGTWGLDALLAFARSWSAHLRAREDGHETWLDALEAEARAALGNAPVRISLPLSVLAARVVR